MAPRKKYSIIKTKEEVDLPREESDAAAAGLPLPTPPSERFQERLHGAPEAGGRSPSTPTVVAATKRKGKEVVDSSRRSSAGGGSPLSPRADSVSGTSNLKSAGGKAPLSPRPMSHSEVVARARRKRTIDTMDQAKWPTIWPAKVYKKSLWRKTVNISQIFRHYKLLEMVAGRGEFGSNALKFCPAYSEFRPVHGDGECFYRSFILSYLEQVLDRQDTHEEHRLLAAVKKVARQHACIGWASEFSRNHKVKSRTIWPAKVNEKSLWRKFSDRTGKSKGNYTIMNPHVSYQTVNMSQIIRHHKLLEMVAARGEFGSNALKFCPAYSEFTPVHGDGECFYRSFILSYLAFKKLIKKVIRWKACSRWKHGPATTSYGQDKLLEFFSSYESTNETIWICSRSEEFEQAVLSESCILIDLCFEKVIHHKVFRDQVQITSLVRALGVPLEYLFQEAGQDPLYTGISRNDMPRSTCWLCQHPQQPPNYEVPLVTLPHMNEHYDIIYPDQRQQIAQFTKRRNRAKAGQALLPPSIPNGSYASAVGAAVRVGWLVLSSVFNSVLYWIAGCCFCKRGRPQAPSPEFTWLSVMGHPIINSDSSCAISACTMCIEAQHRLVFERLNGRGSFTFQAKVPAELKKICYRKGLWNSKNGAYVQQVLLVIAAKGGVMTQRIPNSIRLPIDGFFTIDIDDINGYQLMRIIYAHGPIIGTLFTVDDCYHRTMGDSIYRGVKEEFKTQDYGAYHAVVCFGYKLEKEAKELYIHIMDNHTETGPLRWIELSAFEHFFVPLITKPVDFHQLRRKKGKAKHVLEARLYEWKKKITLWLIDREIGRYWLCSFELISAYFSALQQYFPLIKFQHFYSNFSCFQLHRTEPLSTSQSSNRFPALPRLP